MFFCFLSILFSCSPSEVTQDQLQAYIRDADNGLLKSQERNGYKVEVYYKPQDLLIAQELKAYPSPTVKTVDSLAQKFRNQHYFIVSFSKDDREVLQQLQSDQGLFNEMIQVISYRMGGFVSLKADTSALELIDYVYPRTYGMSAATTLIFAFEKDKTKADKLNLHIKEFGLGLGNFNFPFSTSDLQNIPSINFLKTESND